MHADSRASKTPGGGTDSTAKNDQNTKSVVNVLQLLHISSCSCSAYISSPSAHEETLKNPWRRLLHSQRSSAEPENVRLGCGGGSGGTKALDRQPGQAQWWPSNGSQNIFYYHLMLEEGKVATATCEPWWHLYLAALLQHPTCAAEREQTPESRLENLGMR